jgi:hypothetical protein
VPQQELQEDVQRFAGYLIERTGQASLEVMGSGKPDAISTEALRRAVTHESAALDIATEPLPEVAVLDMLVFVRLNRHVLADYWIPKVFGERGRPFLVAFEEAEKQLWPIVDKILDPTQRDALTRRIDEWWRANPDLVHVEFVRLTAFSARAGSAALARPEEVGGFLASVRGATKAADEAVLLADRALFLASKLPFFVRHQARLGGREIASDTMELVGGAQALTEIVKNLQPILAELPALAAQGTEAAREARRLVADLRTIIPTPEQVARLEHMLEAVSGLIKKANALMGHLHTTHEIPEGAREPPIAHVAGRVGGRIGRRLASLIVRIDRSRWNRHAPVM